MSHQSTIHKNNEGAKLIQYMPCMGNRMRLLMFLLQVRSSAGPSGVGAERGRW